MLLVLSNSQDVTADYLAGVLDTSHVPFIRFNTDVSLGDAEFRFLSELPELRVSGTWYRPTDFDNVWYRRPERLKHPRLSGSPESELILDEWSEALDGFCAHIPFACWMNHPSVNVAASNKIEQITCARRLGLSVPDTLVTQDANELRRFFARNQRRVIVKPLSVGYVERQGGQQDSLIYTNQITERHLQDLTDLPACPTLFQECIRKSSDVRITVVDDELLAVELTAQDADGSQRCDIRRDNMQDVKYRVISLPSDVEQKIRALTRHYNLRFAAIDMAVAESDRWVFFEVNPNGQWAWLDLAGGANISASFVRSFARSAKKGL